MTLKHAPSEPLAAIVAPGEDLTPRSEAAAAVRLDVPAETGQVMERDGTHHAEEVRARVVSGAKVLGLRTGVSLVLRALSALALARLLVKEDYGLFGVVATVAGLGGYFSDFGMGAALVQQEREPTEDELTTVFWCQQAFTGLVIAAILLAMPWLLPVYNVPATATALLTAMTLGLWLSSLRVVPVMSMERKLRFEAQAGCEMFENIVTVAATILFAVLRMGAWSLVAGGLTGRALGLAAIWYASPWRPRGRFDLETARTLLGRGLAFQMNSILPTLLSFPTSMLISNRLTFGNLGLLNWANNLASSPMMLSGILNRLAFPAYSRLQSEPEQLGRLSGIAVQRMGMLLSLVAAPLILTAPTFIPLVFGRQWTDAAPLFQFGLLNAVLEVQLGLLAQTLAASGNVNRLVGLQIGSGVLRLALLGAGIFLFGLVGAAGAAYVGSLLVLVGLLMSARHYLKGCGGIVGQGMKPVFSIHLPVGVGVLAGWGVMQVLGQRFGEMGPLTQSVLRAGIALMVFTFVLSLYDLLAEGQPVRGEVRSLVRLLRGQRGGAATKA